MLGRFAEIIVHGYSLYLVDAFTKYPKCSLSVLAKTHNSVYAERQNNCIPNQIKYIQNDGRKAISVTCKMF